MASLQVAPSEVTWKRGVDVLCLGGTKNGMAVGDCVVFFNRELGQEFEYRCKQAGQLASKMRFLSAPWVGMLTDEAWLKNAGHANQMAKLLSSGLEKLGIRIAAPVESNAVFADFSVEQTVSLRERGWIFYEFDGIATPRLMCSWKTTPEEVDAFLTDRVAAAAPIIPCYRSPVLPICVLLITLTYEQPGTTITRLPTLPKF